MVSILDSTTFKEKYKFTINLMPLRPDEREPNQIIAVRLCQDENYLAVISGKNLIRDEQQPNMMFIFKLG
jgi:hypothetical protein